MIGHYSDDEIYADNRHLECQLKKEKADNAALRADLDKMSELYHEVQVAYDKLFDEAAAGFAERDQRIAALEKLVLDVQDCGYLSRDICVGDDWFEIRDSLLQ